MLGADVVVSELQRFAERQLEDLLGARRERDMPGRGGLALTDDLLDLLAHALQRDVHRLERLRRDALALVDETQQEVLGTDVIVVEHPRLFLREDDHPSGPVGESFKHAVPPGAHERSVRRRVPLGSPDPVLPRRQLRRPASACRAPSAPEGDYTRGV